MATITKAKYSADVINDKPTETTKESSLPQTTSSQSHIRRTRWELNGPYRTNNAILVCQTKRVMGALSYEGDVTARKPEGP